MKRNEHCVKSLWQIQQTPGDSGPVNKRQPERNWFSFSSQQYKKYLKSAANLFWS